MTGQVYEGDGWTVTNSDCVEGVAGLADDSVDLSVYSPPFISLYTYTASERDMGNCASKDEFFDHFGFLLRELIRVTKPGRLTCCHVQQVAAMLERDGYIGLKDFRGDIIREFQKRGFIFHSEHCIWKDPLIEATRTKAIGLMHKQLCKDSAMSRAGIPQYLLAFRAPGENQSRVAHPDGLTRFIGEDDPASQGNASHERWRRYASPVWMDIRITRTLNYTAGRAADDERHICPLALDIIERAVELWTNPGDVVLSPFGGIGSEPYVACQLGRRGIAVELKSSYYRQMVANLRSLASQSDMFAA